MTVTRHPGPGTPQGPTRAGRREKSNAVGITESFGRNQSSGRPVRIPAIGPGPHQAQRFEKDSHGIPAFYQNRRSGQIGWPAIHNLTQGLLSVTINCLFFSRRAAAGTPWELLVAVACRREAIGLAHTLETSNCFKSIAVQVNSEDAPRKSLTSLENDPASSIRIWKNDCVRLPGKAQRRDLGSILP